MKYTIIHINNRAKNTIDHNKKILKEFEYVDSIKFVNGNAENALKAINDRGIRTETWKPYDKRSLPALPGEYGVWMSNLNVWEYLIRSNETRFLVLEDDILLKNNFLKTFANCLSELPKGWDFLSLHYFNEQNIKTPESDAGQKHIHKSINQPAANQAMLYSKSGALKLLRLVAKKGIEYTVDCFIYEQSRLGLVNGYSISPEIPKIVSHCHKEIASEVDPDGIRGVAL